MARILVVDDMPDGRALLSKRLRAEGHEVVEASDGTGALAAIESGGLDLVLLDAMMPPPDGFEVCRTAKQDLLARGEFLPIIMVTALGKEETERALTAGADDYITKGFNPRELMARVNVQIRTLDYHRKLQEALRKEEELTLQLKSANRRLAEMATTDGLTGLLNHRRLQDQLREEGRRAKRQKQCMGALMVDIDCFKGLNDTHGHLFGDRVLQHVAETIRQSLRDVDVLGRYGGEEFGALLIEATKKEAIEAGERVRAAVAEAPFRAEGHEPARVTVSVGAASYPDDCEDDHPERILAKADMALYAAKRNGRNRVEHLARHAFEFSPEAGDVVSTVSVSGDFNGWNRTSHPLALGDDGVWRLSTVVPTGRLRYKFYLNAERFVPDPAAKITEVDQFKAPISVAIIRT